jgi:hypothetical protein
MTQQLVCISPVGSYSYGDVVNNPDHHHKLDGG